MVKIFKGKEKVQSTITVLDEYTSPSFNQTMKRPSPRQLAAN